MLALIADVGSNVFDLRLAHGERPQSRLPEVLATFQAARMGYFFLSQGIGLRPQPRAGVSRPVGPVDRPTDRPEHPAATCTVSSFGALAPGSTQEPSPIALM